MASALARCSASPPPSEITRQRAAPLRGMNNWCRGFHQKARIDQALDKDKIAGVDRRSVLQRDHLVVAIETGMDLPLVGGADLGEGCTLRHDAEPLEPEAIA